MELPPSQTISSDSPHQFEELNQGRMELMSLRVQRRKIQLLAQELTTLQAMYVGKVEEVTQLRTQNRRLNNLLELYQNQKNELLQELELLKETHTNTKDDLETMYTENAHYQKLLEDLRLGQHQFSTQAQIASKKILQQRVRQLQFQVSELEKQLEVLKTEPSAEDRRLKAQLVFIEKQLRDEKSSHRKTQQTLRTTKRHFEAAVEEIQRLKSLVVESQRNVEQVKSRNIQLKNEYQASRQMLSKFVPKNDNKTQYVQRTKTNLQQLKQIQMQKIDQVIETHALRSSRDRHIG